MANILQSFIDIVNDADLRLRRDLAGLSTFPTFYSNTSKIKSERYEDIITEATLTLYANPEYHYLIKEDNADDIKTFFKTFVRTQLHVEKENRKKERRAVSIYKLKNWSK